MTSKKSSNRDPIAIEQEPRKRHPDLFKPQSHDETVQKKLSHYEKGCTLLRKRIRAGESAENLAKSREILGQEAWSLMHLYDKRLSTEQMKELGIVPTMGKVIGRGQTGKDITR